MNITTVKQLDNGYLINGTTTVPENYSGWMREPLDAWLAENTPEPADVPSAEQLAQDAKNQIDTAAGQARARFVSPGDLVEQEYLQAKAEASEYLASGGEIPPAVQSWSDASGMSAQDAATDIINTATAWASALNNIRAIRLAGKSAVDSTGPEAAADYIEQLNAINPA